MGLKSPWLKSPGLRYPSSDWTWVNKFVKTYSVLQYTYKRLLRRGDIGYCAILTYVAIYDAVFECSFLEIVCDFMPSSRTFQLI
jgi:hypothetical protein